MADSSHARNDPSSNKVFILLKLVGASIPNESQDGVWNTLYELLQKGERGEDQGAFHQLLRFNVTKVLVDAVVLVDANSAGRRIASISSMFWSLDAIVCLMRVLQNSPYREPSETGQNWRYLRQSLPALVDASLGCHYLFDGTMGGPINTFRIRTAECLFLVLNSAGAGRAPNASPTPHVTACITLMSKIWWKLLEKELKESDALSEKLASILAHCVLDLYERRIGSMNAETLMGNDHRNIVNHYIRITSAKTMPLTARISHFQLIAALAVLDRTPSFMRAVFSRKVLRRSIIMLEETLRERPDRADVHDVAIAAWNELCRVAIIEGEWRFTTDAVASGLFAYMFKWSVDTPAVQLKQCEALLAKISLGASFDREVCMDAGQQLALIINEIPSAPRPVPDEVTQIWVGMHKIYADLARESHSATTCERPQCQMPWSVTGKQLQACSVCKFALYCSATCQKQDWKRHRGSCIAPL